MKTINWFDFRCSFKKKKLRKMGYDIKNSIRFEMVRIDKNLIICTDNEMWKIPIEYYKEILSYSNKEEK